MFALYKVGHIKRTGNLVVKLKLGHWEDTMIYFKRNPTAKVPSGIFALWMKWRLQPCVQTQSDILFKIRGYHPLLIHWGNGDPRIQPIAISIYISHLLSFSNTLSLSNSSLWELTCSLSNLHHSSQNHFHHLLKSSCYILAQYSLSHAHLRHPPQLLPFFSGGTECLHSYVPSSPLFHGAPRLFFLSILAPFFRFCFKIKAQERNLATYRCFLAGQNRWCH